MGDTSGCQISSQNLAVYLQGVSVEPSSNLTSEYFCDGIPTILGVATTRMAVHNAGYHYGS